MLVRWVSGVRRATVVLALTGSLVAGCATAEQGEVWDPLETPNRFLFALNKTLDTFILRPLAVTYRDLTPNGVQRGTRNVLNNLGEPVTAVNEAAQGEGTRAAQTLARFLINSTIGILGIFDVAKQIGLPHTKEDFGQTIGVWAKAPPEDGGPYLVLPLVGPSNARDAVGLLVDYLVDPFRIAAHHFDVDWLLYARAGVAAVDGRSRTLQALDDIEKNSVDFYSAVRSAYTQRRAAQIRERGVVAAAALPLDSVGRAEFGLAR
ncbi:MAG: VacJ family lipoprotein [Alphaproteobacteria bacterium]|nr:VacJ family lipoprotein [Alphaproteobacteria bacterium]